MVEEGGRGMCSLLFYAKQSIELEGDQWSRLTFYFYRRAVIALVHQAPEENRDVVDIALLENRRILWFRRESSWSAFIPKGFIVLCT